MFLTKAFSFLILISSILVFAACPAPTTNVNTNVSNNASNNSNTNVNTSTSSTIEAKEPEKYQATVKLKFTTTGGDQKYTIPGDLNANVARDGNNRRMEFTMPNGDKVVYLDVNGKHLLVLPNRKQFAELNRDSVGFDVRSMMTPGQIVQQVKSVKGVQKVGEERYNDRDAIKYQYDATTDTKSKAGNVETKSFIYVDKETGLPLHSETTAVASGGSYQGVQGLQVVTEMSNIQTTVDPALFAEPTDFKKVEPAEVKQQVDTIFNVIVNFLGTMLKTSQSTTSPTPTP